MTSATTEGVSVSRIDSAPIYDNVRRMADFLAEQIGRELAFCALDCPEQWDNVYVARCFRSYEDLMEFVGCHIDCCYLSTVLLAIGNKDNELCDNLNGLDYRRVSACILKHSKHWFDTYTQG